LFEPDGPAPASLQYASLEYDGSVPELYRIFWRNLLLNVLTLGFYRFWGITRTRRYLWSRMRFMGDRFEYTGTGGEKFRGFLLAMLVFGAVVGANFAISLFAQRTGVRSLSFLLLPTSLFYVSLFGAAVFSAQRYRLSRTVWRGIRGGMGNGAFAYGLLTVWYFVASGATLGLLWPVLRMRLIERRINASNFGSASMALRGRGRALYGPFLLGLLAKLLLGTLLAATVVLALALLRPAGALNSPVIAKFFVGFAWVLAFGFFRGLADAWFDAAFVRQLLGNLRYAELRFGCAFTGRTLFHLRLGNAAIRFATLGLGTPFVTQRCARFIAANIQVLGSLETGALYQTTVAAPRLGEGLLEALGVGIAG
jgi:uncharacterized membrane protein YjgN (DUF898 family)